MATEADLAWWTSQSGRNWDQLCQAWCWNIADQFGFAPVSYASALDAYYATPIVSYDAFSAPPGSCVFYDIGQYGHVGWEVDTGNGMGSGKVTVVWGINAGVAGVEEYVARTGATPLGWGWTNGVNTLNYESAGAPVPPPGGEDDLMPWFFRASSGTIVIVTPVGPRYITPDEFDVYRNLGQAKYPPGMDAMDEGPFNAIIASLGGIVE